MNSLPQNSRYNYIESNHPFVLLCTLKVKMIVDEITNISFPRTIFTCPPFVARFVKGTTVLLAIRIQVSLASNGKNTILIVHFKIKVIYIYKSPF